MSAPIALSKLAIDACSSPRRRERNLLTGTASSPGRPRARIAPSAWKRMFRACWSSPRVGGRLRSKPGSGRCTAEHASVALVAKSFSAERSTSAAYAITPMSTARRTAPTPSHRRFERDGRVPVSIVREGKGWVASSCSSGHQTTGRWRLGGWDLIRPQGRRHDRVIGALVRLDLERGPSDPDLVTGTQRHGGSDPLPVLTKVPLVESRSSTTTIRPSHAAPHGGATPRDPPPRGRLPDDRWPPRGRARPACPPPDGCHHNRWQPSPPGSANDVTRDRVARSLSVACHRTLTSGPIRRWVPLRRPASARRRRATTHTFAQFQSTTWR